MHYASCHSDGAYKTLGSRLMGWTSWWLETLPLCAAANGECSKRTSTSSLDEHPHFKTSYVAQSREQSSKRKADES
eukprot:5515171-Amphidinium_carterae.1